MVACDGLAVCIVGVYAELTQQRVVTQHPRIVQRLLPRLDLSAVHIIALIIAERPADAHVWVGVFKPCKVLSAYPPALVGIPASHSVGEQTGSVTDVVDDEITPLLRVHGTIRDSAAASEQVNQRVGLWDVCHNPLCDLVFAPHVGESVILAHLFLLFRFK